jgi:hypothetical protein
MTIPPGDVEDPDDDPLVLGKQLQPIREDRDLGDGRSPFDRARDEPQAVLCGPRHPVAEPVIL